MSKLVKGAVSFSSFRAEGTMPSREKVRELLAAHVFKPLKPEDERDESVGWVDAIWSFDTERFPNLFSGSMLMLSMRVDRYSFSASQLRPFLEEAEYHYKTVNNLEYLSAQQRKELREAEIRKMRQNSFPRTTIVEMVWTIDENNIYLLTTSSAMVKRFMPLFENTFGFSLGERPLLDEESIGGTAHDGTLLVHLWEQD